MSNLREELAALAHAQWAGWLAYQFRIMRKNADGLWEIPLDAGLRWQRQMMTPYAELPEGEKRSDRAEADKVLALLDRHQEDA